jgi:hypothetical protein
MWKSRSVIVSRVAVERPLWCELPQPLASSAADAANSAATTAAQSTRERVVTPPGI